LKKVNISVPFAGELYPEQQKAAEKCLIAIRGYLKLLLHLEKQQLVMFGICT
jgi:hypothetical protein